MAATTEVKHALRKLEYPLCATEALFKIEQLLQLRSNSIKHADLAMDLATEFIFCEVDRRGTRRNPSLTFLQELHLLQVLIKYFDGASSEVQKNSVFLLIFGNVNVHLRIKILAKFVSLSVCVPTVPALIAASIWMHQMGSASSHSCQLVSALISDFFVFTPAAISQLKNLPKIAPQFAANFLTVVAELHLMDKRIAFVTPPVNLLEIITAWLSENPKLSLAAHASHSAGAIQMTPGVAHQMPVFLTAGLLKWCILAPLQYAIQRESNNTFESTATELYAKLHLALLESFLDDGMSSTSTGVLPTVSAQHLLAVIPPLQTQIGQLLNLGRCVRTDPHLQLALDRLAQAVQVALYSRSMYGNIQELLNQLDQLPDNRLLKIVLNANKQIVL